jgi:hypothetical protein
MYFKGLLAYIIWRHCIKLNGISVWPTSEVRSSPMLLQEIKAVTGDPNGMMVAVFWVDTPCSLVEIYRRFRGAGCLCHQGTE